MCSPQLKKTITIFSQTLAIWYCQKWSSIIETIIKIGYDLFIVFYLFLISVFSEYVFKECGCEPVVVWEKQACDNHNC